MIKPKFDYIYGREIKKDTGVVSMHSVADTKQYYEVLAVGEGRHQNGVFVPTTVQVGEVVVIQKQAAEGDTPREMYERGFALFMESRVMATEEEDK